MLCGKKMMVLRGTSHVELFFDNVPLQPIHLLGDEGRGMNLILSTLGRVRLAQVGARGTRINNTSPGKESGWIARLNDAYIRDPLGVVGIKTGNLLDFRGGNIQSVQLSSVADYGFDLDPRYADNSRYRNKIIQALREQDKERLVKEAAEVIESEARSQRPG